MDKEFHQAAKAVKTGDLDLFKQSLIDNPSLATARSSTSHPTLLQCVALDGHDVAHNVEMAKLLIDAGAELDDPLVACASIGNLEVGKALLDAGADIEAGGRWSPLEEALYWGNDSFVAMLLERGAAVKNLRAAAGLGRLDLLETFFGSDGRLKPEAGRIDWPFGDPQKSNLNNKIKKGLQTARDAWSNEPRYIINNAFIYACMRDQIEAAKFLLEKGAAVNEMPHGFDYAGTGLH
ncbi:MAG TPA: ankyrin repeat domain-containing protein, partial [Pyrinomonadaceae bacterium]